MGIRNTPWTVGASTLEFLCVSKIPIAHKISKAQRLTKKKAFENFDDTAEDTTKQKEYKAKQRKWVKDNFEVAGDYRPERLYAKMASGRWADVTFAGASFLVDGKKELYEEWKRQGNNADVSDRLESLFKSISLRREEDGMTTIGTRFKLDAAKIGRQTSSHHPYRQPLNQPG